VFSNLCALDLRREIIEPKFERRATVDEDGHYCFAAALWCDGRLRVPIGKAATPFDFALRAAGGWLPDSAGSFGWPSIADPSINPGIHVIADIRHSTAVDQSLSPRRMNSAIFSTTSSSIPA
jgi:hypothetical protein